MSYIIAISTMLVLLLLFLLLVVVEKRSGKRVCARRRYVLDQKVSRTAFIMQHVDWGAFAHDLTRTSVERMLHDIAHGSLLAVRALERTLTRLVRTLRTRRDTPLPPVHAPHTNRLESARVYIQHIIKRSKKTNTVEGTAQER